MHELRLKWAILLCITKQNFYGAAHSSLSSCKINLRYVDESLAELMIQSPPTQSHLI